MTGAQRMGRPCVQCGVPIAGRAHNAKYCPVCAKKVKNDQARGRKKARDAKRAKLSAGEIEIAARKAGMSYGEYVGKFGL